MFRVEFSKFRLDIEMMEREIVGCLECLVENILSINI